MIEQGKIRLLQDRMGLYKGTVVEVGEGGMDCGTAHTLVVEFGAAEYVTDKVDAAKDKQSDGAPSKPRRRKTSPKTKSK